MPAKQIQSTTQEFIDIYDITNDLTIMKNGSCSLIITVDALNFGLLAEEEQDGIMYSYAGLLNSLNYPIQIVIRSQTKDATNYLNLIREQELRATSDLKKSQIRAYAGFVADLIRERNVLDKKFYIVIPASALEMGLLPPSTVVPGIKQIDVSTIERSVILDKAKTILEPKRDHLISQFARIGLSARQLTTQEIIQLFYASYNPEAAEGQQITNSNDYTTSMVSGQTGMTEPLVAQPTPSPTPTPVATPMMAAAPETTTTPTTTPEAPMVAPPEPVADPYPELPPTISPSEPQVARVAPSVVTQEVDPLPTQVFEATPPIESGVGGTFNVGGAPNVGGALTTDSTDDPQHMIDLTAQQVVENPLSPSPTGPRFSDPNTANPPGVSTKPLTPSTPTTDDLPPLPEI